MIEILAQQIFLLQTTIVLISYCNDRLIKVFRTSFNVHNASLLARYLFVN